MLTKAPFSKLCLLSLTIPLLGHAGNSWLFNGSPTETAITPELASSSKTVPPVCKKECDVPECEAKPCCETKTRTEVITICEDPCHPTHCKWDVVLSAGLGYRHDRLNQRFKPTPSTSPQQNAKFKYNGVDSVMGLLRLDARYSNFLLSVEGDYSPVVSGSMSSHFNTDTAVGDTFHFKNHKLTGYEADAMASVGYRLQFMHGYHARAALIFQVGYRYSHQAWETEKQSRASRGTFISILQDQGPMHSEWFGPFLEGRFSFAYRDKFYFQPFYQYHFLDYRSQRKEAQKVYDYTVVGTPPVPLDILTRFTTEGNHATGQLGGIDLFYDRPGYHYRFGIKTTYLRFVSNKSHTNATEKQVLLVTNPPGSINGKLKYRTHSTWESFNIALYAGYSF